MYDKCQTLLAKDLTLPWEGAYQDDAYYTQHTVGDFQVGIPSDAYVVMFVL